MTSTENDVTASNDDLKRPLTIFDLVQVGLSSTLSIGVFITIGYVIRSVSGPSVILSITIAAVVAFLAGSFYYELNLALITRPKSKSPSISTASTASCPIENGLESTTVSVDATNEQPKTAKLLLSSCVLTYFCIGEWAAFGVAWNLLLEYVIGVALVAKGIAGYAESLAFDSSESNVSARPIPWNSFSAFDLVAFFIPILAGSK